MMSSNIVKYCVSGKHHECKPLFVENDELMIIAAGLVIQIMSSLTGEVVRACRMHESSVVSLQLHPSQHDCLISASRDGEVIMWNYKSLALVRRYKTGKTLHQVLVCPSFALAADGFPLKLFLVFSVQPSEYY